MRIIIQYYGFEPILNFAKRRSLKVKQVLLLRLMRRPMMIQFSTQLSLRQNVGLCLDSNLRPRALGVINLLLFEQRLFVLYEICKVLVNTACSTSILFNEVNI